MGQYSKKLGPRLRGLGPAGFGAHKIVAHVASGIGMGVYEHMAKKSNEFYAANPDPQKWLEHNWARYIPMARKQLARMLAEPGRSEDEKAAIHEALVLDVSIPRGLGKAPQSAKGLN